MTLGDKRRNKPHILALINRAVPHGTPPKMARLARVPAAFCAGSGRRLDRFEAEAVPEVARFPRNAAYCAAWNSGFLTTFSHSSGSRNPRGEMAQV